jgi:hypothetical protein
MSTLDNISITYLRQFVNDREVGGDGVICLAAPEKSQYKHGVGDQLNPASRTCRSRMGSSARTSDLGFVQHSLAEVRAESLLSVQMGAFRSARRTEADEPLPARPKAQ